MGVVRAIVLVSLLVSIAGCWPGGSESARVEPRGLDELSLAARKTGSEPLNVIATTTLVAEVVERVGQPYVQVRALMGPRSDPHLYRPTPGDVRALATADVVFYNGLHLEGKMGEYLHELGRSKPVVPLGEYLGSSRLLATSEASFDPHIWFDPDLWADAALVAGRALAQLDPPRAEHYSRQAADYAAEVRALSDDLSAQLATIPEQRRVMVTAHDAFQYFGRAFKMEVRGVQGVSTDSETGLRELERLVDFLVTRKIPAVFVETSVNDAKVRALIDGAAAQGHRVQMAEPELFSDALGDPGTPEGSYVGMMRANVSTLVEALR